MKMDAATIAKYPRFHHYVSVNMPEVAHVKAIISQVKKLAGKTPSATIVNALKYGNDPRITVVPGLVCAGVASYGCYAWGSNEIRIDEDIVKDFEAGKGQFKTKHGKLVYLVGVTLLHELTHWADAQDGSTTWSRAIPATRKETPTRKVCTARSCRKSRHARSEDRPALLCRYWPPVRGPELGVYEKSAHARGRRRLRLCRIAD